LLHQLQVSLLGHAWQLTSENRILQSAGYAFNICMTDTLIAQGNGAYLRFVAECNSKILAQPSKSPAILAWCYSDRISMFPLSQPSFVAIKPSATAKKI
jgi:hypothetical protein